MPAGEYWDYQLIQNYIYPRATFGEEPYASKLKAAPDEMIPMFRPRGDPRGGRRRRDQRLLAHHGLKIIEKGGKGVERGPPHGFARSGGGAGAKRPFPPPAARGPGPGSWNPGREGGGGARAGWADEAQNLGGGGGGLTAGLFAARHGLCTLILESNIPGGHLISIEKIEDFPGFPDGIAGYDLCPTVQRQAADQGAEFQRAEVSSLEAQDRLWSVVTDEERHRAKAVIVATGSTAQNLDVPGEEKLMGRGVSHCASCDGPLYNGQTVGVVGGGDSALQETLTLANYAERVLLFHDGEKFSAQQTYQQRVLGNTKIMPRYRTVVEKF